MNGNRMLIRRFLIACVIFVHPLLLRTALALPFTLTTTIDNPAPIQNAAFGSTINSFNGNVLVGATGSGADAYLMNISTGAQMLKLTSPDVGHGEVSFGDSLLQVGQNIAVADFQADVGSYVRSGSVYLFNGATGENLLTIRDPNPQTFGYFGCSIEGVSGKLLVSA